MSTSSSEIPFEFQVEIPSRGEEVDAELWLESSVGEEGDEEPLLLACDEVVRLFALSIGDQFFSAGSGPVGQSQLELLDSKMGRGGAHYYYRMRMRAVPPNAFLVLLGMLVQNVYSGDPLARVMLRPLRPLVHPIATAGLLALERVAARRYQPLSFALNYSQSRRERLVTYEFAAPLSRSTAEEVQEMLNRWDHLMVLGGFRLDFKEVDSIPEFGSSAHVAPAVLEHRISDFEGDESAFETLVNFGMGLTARGLPLRTMSIE